MILPGHLAGGYLAAEIILAIGHPAFSTPELSALALVGIIAGELPDIDLIWLYFEHRGERKNKTTNHREYITHAPLFWLMLSLIIVTLGSTTDNIFLQYFGWIILGGTWSHFILDSIEHGVSWFSPFISDRYYLLDTPEIEIADARHGTISHHWKFITRHYVGRLSFYAEIVVVVLALITAIWWQ